MTESEKKNTTVLVSRGEERANECFLFFRFFVQIHCRTTRVELGADERDERQEKRKRDRTHRCTDESRVLGLLVDTRHHDNAAHVACVGIGDCVCAVVSIVVESNRRHVERR
jgi:hypothetical protein